MYAVNIAEQANGWREDLQHYERNLEEMTSVNLDQVNTLLFIRNNNKHYSNFIFFCRLEL